jgi:arsenate reductase-like glutaredoxin family protein
MQLTVYSASWCRDCREAKRFLAKHNIPFTEVDIETTPGAADTVLEIVGQRAFCTPRWHSCSGSATKLLAADRMAGVQ